MFFCCGLNFVKVQNKNYLLSFSTVPLNSFIAKWQSICRSVPAFKSIYFYLGFSLSSSSSWKMLFFWLEYHSQGRGRGRSGGGTVIDCSLFRPSLASLLHVQSPLLMLYHPDPLPLAFTVLSDPHSCLSTSEPSHPSWLLFFRNLDVLVLFPYQQAPFVDSTASCSSLLLSYLLCVFPPFVLLLSSLDSSSFSIFFINTY